MYYLKYVMISILFIIFYIYDSVNGLQLISNIDYYNITHGYLLKSFYILYFLNVFIIKHSHNKLLSTYNRLFSNIVIFILNSNITQNYNIK